MPGVSLRNGPVEEDTPMTNGIVPQGNGTHINGLGTQKRKARESLNKPKYTEAASSEDDDAPLVSTASHAAFIGQ